MPILQVAALCSNLSTGRSNWVTQGETSESFDIQRIVVEEERWHQSILPKFNSYVRCCCVVACCKHTLCCKVSCEPFSPNHKTCNMPKCPSRKCHFIILKCNSNSCSHPHIHILSLLGANHNKDSTLELLFANQYWAPRGLRWPKVKLQTLCERVKVPYFLLSCLKNAWDWIIWFQCLDDSAKIS